MFDFCVSNDMREKKEKWRISTYILAYLLTVIAKKLKINVD